MFKKIGKLLITNISYNDLYVLAERIHNEIIRSDQVHQRVALHVQVLAKIMDEYSEALHRSRRSPYTKDITARHRERTNLFTALRRYINATLKMVSDPSKVQAAENLKNTMKNSRLWVYDTISYDLTSLMIRGLKVKSEKESLRQWFEEIGATRLLKDLFKIQKEYEILTLKRNDFLALNRKPQKKQTRRKLIEALYPLLSAIDFGTLYESRVFAEIAGKIRILIRDTNTVTKARQTRIKNKKEKLDTIRTNNASTSEEIEEEGNLVASDLHDQPRSIKTKPSRENPVPDDPDPGGIP